MDTIKAKEAPIIENPHKVKVPRPTESTRLL